ncbi:MAG: ribosome biogenesis domain-containing protein [Thermoplasmata archaeon]
MGSTENPSDSSGVPLLLVLAGEDHPKACTGRRLVRSGLVREVAAGRPLRHRPILLDPRDERPLCAADRSLARRVGVLGVDCSWNRLNARGGYPTFGGWIDRLAVRRRLPFLLAGNPQHFGRVGELNTAEAFAAALSVLGEATRARDLLASFPGGEAFFSLNREPLGSYARATDANDVRAAEREYF